MAKLSAHGDEIARLVTEHEIPDAHYERHLSFRSDGHILKRTVVVHEGRRTDSGWKLWKRLSPGASEQRVPRTRAIAQRRAALAEADETLVKFETNGAIQ